MELLSQWGRDLLFVAVAASCCEMILPKSDVKAPLRFVFGLWFLLLMLQPLTALTGELPQLAPPDIADLELMNDDVSADVEAAVRNEAAAAFAAELNGKLAAVFPAASPRATVVIGDDDAAEVTVTVVDDAVTADILSYLASAYGLTAATVKVERERSELP